MFGERARAERAARGEVRQVGRDLAGGVGAADRVARRTRDRMKTSWPSRSTAPGGERDGCRIAASQPSKSSSDSATTSSAMCACCRPQNSAHWPRKMPGRSACSQIAVV